MNDTLTYQYPIYKKRFHIKCIVKYGGMAFMDVLGINEQKMMEESYLYYLITIDGQAKYILSLEVNV